MAQFRIVCARQEPVQVPDCETHVVAVGTGLRAGRHDMLWSLEEVIAAMDHGHVFYTFGERTGRRTGVERFACAACQRVLIRSEPGALDDNNLSNLPCI